MEEPRRAREISPLIKLKICLYAYDYRPESVREVQNYAATLLQWMPDPSTISTILLHNHLPISQDGRAGRPVVGDIMDRVSVGAHLYKSCLTLRNTRRIRTGQHDELEFRILENVYKQMIIGERLISKEFLLDSVQTLANEHGLSTPTNVLDFFRKLEKKYYLASWIGKFFRGTISYPQLIEGLQEVFRSLAFASTTPGGVVNVHEEDLSLNSSFDEISLPQQTTSISFNNSHDAEQNETDNWASAGYGSILSNTLEEESLELNTYIPVVESTISSPLQGQISITSGYAEFTFPHSHQDDVDMDNYSFIYESLNEGNPSNQSSIDANRDETTIIDWAMIDDMINFSPEGPGEELEGFPVVYRSEISDSLLNNFSDWY